MPSEQAIQFREMFAQTGASITEAPSIDDIRSTFAHFGNLATPLGPDTTVDPVMADGVPCLWVVPPDTAETVVVYFHGGGYIMGSAETHSRAAGHLARRLAARALVVDYRLAPEHPHPAPVEDCLRAYEWLLGSGVDPANVLFAGESAGGALTITTQLLARDREIPLPAATASLSPWLDLESFGVGDAGASGAAAMVQQFLGPNGDIRDPLVDPLRGKLTGLGPLYIQVGGDEVGFIAPAERLADAARAEGIRVEIDIVPDMQHMFQLWAGNMPEADDALDRIAAFFASVLAP